MTNQPKTQKELTIMATKIDIRAQLTHHATGGSLPSLDIPMSIKKNERVTLAFCHQPNDVHHGLNSVVITGVKSGSNYMEFIKVHGLDEILSAHFAIGVRDTPATFCSVYVVPPNAITESHTLKRNKCLPQILKITSKRFITDLQKSLISHQNKTRRPIDQGNPLVLEIERTGEGFQTAYSLTTIGGLKSEGEFQPSLDALNDLSYPIDEIEIMEAIQEFKSRRN